MTASVAGVRVLVDARGSFTIFCPCGEEIHVPVSEKIMVSEHTEFKRTIDCACKATYVCRMKSRRDWRGFGATIAAQLPIRLHRREADE